MTAKPIRTLSIATLAALTPALAFAHPGSGDAHGLTHGLMHPLSGLDHILAMVMVGIIAAQIGGRTLWLLPTAFLAMMALGGALGATGTDIAFVEVGIALSVLVLGAIVALGIKAPVAAATALVGLFAVFHGHAHGAEMPDTASALAYAAGFMIATALLHAAGIALGVTMGNARGRVSRLALRSAGGLAAVAGAGLLAGVL